jgi:hypothetical protein
MLFFMVELSAVGMEENMVKAVFFAVGALAIAVTTPALAYERHYDFDQIWVDTVRPHERDPALSAPPRDVMRHQPGPTFYGRPHDPSGNIILEGAR